MLLCLGMLLLGFAPALVEPESTLTLESALARALASNPALASARLQVEAAAGSAVQSRSWPNPELTFSAEEFPPTSQGFSASRKLAGLAQTVPFPVKTLLDWQAGRRQVGAASWEHQAARTELVRRVKSAFYRVLAMNRKLDATGEIVSVAQALADAAIKRVRTGVAPDQERLRAEIERERVELELSAVRRDMAEAEQALLSLLGASGRRLGPVLGKLDDSLGPAPPDSGLEPALARHPLVRAARAKCERAGLTLWREALEPLPDVTFEVSGNMPITGPETLLTLSASLPLPILDWGRGRRREARALAAIARHDLAATERQLREDLAVAQARYRAAHEQTAAYRDRILPWAEEALRLVRVGFEAGKFGFVDVLDAQRVLTETRLASYDSLLELNIAQADLEALLGESGPHTATPTMRTNPEGKHQ